MSERARRSEGTQFLEGILAGVLLLCAGAAFSEVIPSRGVLDGRIRTAAYSPDQIYLLQGFVGYQIDLEFEPGESFVGLAAGDIEGLSFVAQDNHLFLKPKAASVGTNLTILTSRRHYHVDYSASAKRPDASNTDVIYSLRFQYPARVVENASLTANRVEERLDTAPVTRVRNFNYWYCGQGSLRPVSASDDGIHTSLRFAPRAELPAIFVRNDDDSESLLNFSMQDGEVIIHRVARRFILRRGSLTGCIVNKGYTGSGERLNSGTIAPNVQRDRKGPTP